jgi:hypothetical protein
MKRAYRDIFGQVITLEQLSSMADYEELLIDSDMDLVKKIYHYKNGNLWSIQYYKNGNEEETQLIAMLKTECALFTITEREMSTKNYIIELSSQYSSVDNHKEALWSRVLLNSFEQVLCIETLDSQTRQPIFKETSKYFYAMDNRGREFEILEACYHNNGSLDHIIFKPCGDDNSGQDWEYFYTHNFNLLEPYFADSIRYFLTATLKPDDLISNT